MDDLSLPLLYGARLLFCAEGRPHRWVFGPTHPPRLLVEHPPPLKLVVHDADGGMTPMRCVCVEVDGMTQITGQLDAPSGYGWLEVHARGECLGRWAIEWDNADGLRLDPIRTLRGDGMFRDAIDALDGIEGQSSLDSQALLDALELRARLHRDLGEPDASSAAWQEGADLARALGLPTEAARRLRAAAFHGLVQRRFVDAEALAERARAALAGVRYAPAALRTAYLDGLLADARCDYRGALRHLTRAHRLAVLLDDPHRAVIDGRLAIIEVHLGQMDRARRLLVDGSEQANVHDRVGWLLERAWFACHEHLAGEGAALADARRLVEQARAAVPIEADRRLAARCALTAAWVALVGGRLGDARSAHDECRALSPQGPAQGAHDYGEPSRALLEGRLLLAEGSPAHARGVFEALIGQMRELRAGLPSPLVWSALHGVGQAWLAEGDPEAALATWRRALAELDRAAIDVGRSRLPAFVSAVTLWDASARLMDDVVDLLADRGPRAAFAVVDAHFARRQRTLDARGRVARLDGEARAQWTWRLQALERRLAEYGETRADWSLEPAARRLLLRRRKGRVQAAFDDAMALLDRGTGEGRSRAAVDVLQAEEALLACRRRADGRLESWWVHRGAVHRFIGRALPDVLAERADGIEHLYVITGGSDEAWSLPGMQWDGRPLAARLSLSFVPDGHHIGRRSDPRDGRPAALVDPERDLPHARRDGDWLAEHINAEVASGADADREAWLKALDAPALHFSGHGERDADAPWQGVLRLADQQAIQPEDLAGRSAPCRVVLVGCGTGTAFGAAAISLPTAFLLAGSCSVLATVEPIDDGEASRFVRRFYSAGGLRAPGAALRVAVEASWKAGEAVWRAFRLVGSP